MIQRKRFLTWYNALGLDTKRAALTFRVHVRTIERWCAGTRGIPEWVGLVMELLDRVEGR